MPTGYTFEIKSNRIKTLKDFALLCCRNFGIFAEFRDEPLCEKIPDKLEVSKYYTDKVKKANEKLESFKKEKRTIEKAEKEFIKSFKRAEKSLKKDYKKNKEFIDKCKSLLNEAENWTPPNEEYDNLKGFMIDQLKNTIKYDEFTDKDLKRLIQQEIDSKEQFIENYMYGTDLKDNLEYWNKTLEKEKERIDKKNKWLSVLRNSFK